MPRPLPRRIRWVRTSIASPPVLPSPLRWRVGIRIFTFEACSGFTHVAACWLAQPPKATFVTRLQCRSVTRPPCSSATRPIDSYLGGFSSTGDTRLSGHTAQSGKGRSTDAVAPDFASLHPGYDGSLPVGRVERSDPNRSPTENGRMGFAALYPSYCSSPSPPPESSPDERSDIRDHARRS